MPDLGSYAADVVTAYGVSLVILSALVLTFVVRGRRTKVTLEKIEERLREN